MEIGNPEDGDAEGPREGRIRLEGIGGAANDTGLDRRSGVVHWRVLRAAGLRKSVELGLDSDVGRGARRRIRMVSFFQPFVVVARVTERLLHTYTRISRGP